MSEIKDFNGITRLDTDPDRVLEAAIGKVTEVVICGFGKDGNQFFASSVADGGQALWHLERAKWALMKITDELEGG
jgi:hypothetical protein